MKKLRDSLANYCITREGAATVLTPKDDRIVFDSNVSFDRGLLSVRRRVARGQLSTVLRFRLSSKGTLDYFVFDDIILIVSREIKADPRRAPLHFSTGWCLLRVRIEGDMIEFLDGHARRTRRADCSFLWVGERGMDICYEPPQGAAVTSISIAFRCDRIARKLGMDPLRYLGLRQSDGRSIEPQHYLATVAGNAPIIKAARRILDLPIDGPLSALLAEGRAIELLAEALTGLKDAHLRGGRSLRLRPKEIRQLSMVKGQLEAQCAQHQTLGQLGRAAGLNRRKLTEGFKALFGVTVHEHLLASRMKQATRLLEEGLSVADVSERVGYSGRAGFGKAFKKFYGVAPRTVKA